jgi:general secretion pathway protein K
MSMTQKFLNAPRMRLKDSGIILVSVIWVVLILSILAVTLSRIVGVEIALTKFSLGRSAAYHAARAGVVYASQIIKAKTADQEDTQFACGITVPAGQSKDVLSFEIAEGRFVAVNITDEESRINLNALTRENYAVLVTLLRNMGIEQNQAESIGASVVDWTDSDNQPTNEPYGGDAAYYEGLTPEYKPKNKAFEYPQELFLVKGMTAEIYNQIKDLITVFPQKSEKLMINGNTASPQALLAVLEFINDSTPGLKVDKVDVLVEKIDAFRKGLDGQPATSDDVPLPKDGNIAELLDLDNQEQHLYTRFIQDTHRGISKYFRIKSVGEDKRFNVTAVIEAVFNKDTGESISWQRSL